MRIPALAALALCLSGCGGPKNQGADSGGPVDEGPLQYSPIAQWEGYPFEDFRVRQYIPDDPRGVIFFFHGSGGDVSIVTHIEVVAFLNELIKVGIGFVATDSGDRANGKWIDGDAERVGRLYEHVVDTTALEPDDALFIGGFSAGGSFTGEFALHALDRGFPVKALNPNQVGCFLCPEAGLPTVWVVNENDTSPHDTARSGRDALRDAGVDARVLWNDEQVLHELSFTKHPDMTPERSERVFLDLVDKGLIDADGARLVPDDEMDDWCSWYGNNGESFAPQSREEELRVLWALHRFHGDTSREVRDFFLDHL